MENITKNETGVGSVDYTATLFEGVLNDDMLEVLKSQYVYSGRNNATCKITYYTYANEWSNHKHERYFKSVENAIKWYKREFRDRVILQGGAWLSDEIPEIAEIVNGDYATALDKMTEKQKNDCVDEWENIVVIMA